MKFVVTGSYGQLGREFEKRFHDEKMAFVAVDADTCDITSPEAVQNLIETHRPDVVINCAAYTLVDEAESNPDPAFRVNAEAVRILAEACAGRGIRLVHFGTDYVFDGEKKEPYVESDAPAPLNVYGMSKLKGEAAALAASPDNLVFRTSWVIGMGKQNFLYKLRQWAQEKDVLKISADEISVPTFTSTIVTCVLAALAKDLKGLYHLTNCGQASRMELAQAFLDAAGIREKTLMPVPMASFGLKARRPLCSVLSNQALGQALGINIPAWQEALREYVKTMRF